MKCGSLADLYMERRAPGKKRRMGCMGSEEE